MTLTLRERVLDMACFATGWFTALTVNRWGLWNWQWLVVMAGCIFIRAMVEAVSGKIMIVGFAVGWRKKENGR